MTERRIAILEAIDAGSPARVAEAFTGASEDERRALAKEMARVAAKCEHAPFTIGDDGRLTWAKPADDSYSFERRRAGAVAFLATATMGELRKRGEGSIPAGLDGGPAYRVLLDRKPVWIDEYVAFALQFGGDLEWTPTWSGIRRLVREGHAERPTADAYIEGMVRAPSMVPEGDERAYARALAFSRDRLPDADPAVELLRGATGLLRTDPALLEEEIWRIFEVPDLSPRGADRFNDDQWQRAFVELSGDGTIDRGRVLDAILAALGADRRAAESTWFLDLWKAMTPTPEERSTRAGELLGLLGAAARPVIGFAAEELRVVAKTGALDPSTIPRLAPGAGAPTKKAVTSTLATLDLLVRRDPTMAEAAALVATEALTHPAADVHAKVLDRLERWAPAPGRAVASELERMAPTVAATERPRVMALLRAAHDDGLADGEAGRGGLVSARSPDVHPPAGPGQDAAPTPSELDARLAAIPAEIRAALALPAAASPPLGPLPPAPVAGEPVLDPDEQLEPIATLDQLADALIAHGYEAYWEAPQLETERLTDAILRHCADRSAFEGPMKPAIAEIEGWTEESYFRSAIDVATAWYEGRAGIIDRRSDDEGPERSPAARLSRAIDLAGRGRSQPTVALPTHTGGWIDPQVLVARLTGYEPPGLGLVDGVLSRARSLLRSPAAVAGGDADHDPELEQAFYRLAPDGRATALKLATDVQGRVGELLRCALGGPEIRPAGPAGDAALAVRPGRPLPQVAVRLTRRDDGLLATMAGREACELRVEGLDARGTLPSSVPTFLRATLRRKTKWATTRERPGSVGLAWPAARGFSHARLIGDLAAKNLGPGSGSNPMSLPSLEILLSPGEPIGALAALAITCALGSAAEVQHVLGVDIAVGAVDDGRLDAPLLGRALATGLPNGIFLPARIGARLDTIAKVSPLHLAVARDALEAALGSYVAVLGEPAAAPRQLGPLLTRLAQWCAESDAGITDPAARTVLESLSGGSNAAKAARALLARPAGRPASEAALLLEARVRRAERWARLAGV